MFGVLRKQTSRHQLFQEHKLTLEKCIDVCRSTEANSSQMKEIASSSPTESVNKLSNNSQRSKETKSSWRRKNDRNPEACSKSHDKSTIRQCLFCGNKHEMVKEKCPAWEKTIIMSKCKGRNYFAIVCKKETKVHNVTNRVACEQALLFGRAKRVRGTQRQFSGKYLFERRFEI